MLTKSQADRVGSAPDELIPIEAFRKRVGGISKRGVAKLVAEGKLPPPVKVGRRIFWRASDTALFIRVGCSMEKFLEAQASERE